MANDSIVGILLRAKKDTGAIGDTKAEIIGLDEAAGVASGGLQAMAAAAGVAGAFKLTQQIFELGQTAAQAERARGAFDRMASSVGVSGDTMLAALKKASLGTISDKDLELGATRAKVLGVADSVDKLSTLLDIARVRGAAFGRSAKEAFDDLVTGLGRGSAQILDNLGFKGGQKDLEDYAATVHKTVAELSDAERQGVLFNKVVRETKGEIDNAGNASLDNAGKFERLAASWENFKTAVGNSNATGFAAGVASNALDSFAKEGPTAAISVWQRLFDLMTNGSKNVDDLTGQLKVLEAQEKRLDALVSSGKGVPGIDDSNLAATRQRIAEVRAELDGLTESGDQSQSTIQQLSAILPGFGANSNAAAAAQANLKRGVDAATASLDAERAAVVSLAGALPGLQAAVNSQIQGALNARNSAVARIAGQAAGVEGIVGQTEATRQFGAAVDEVDAKYAELNAQLVSGNLTTDEFQLKIAELGNTGGDAFEQIHRSQQEAEASAKKYANTVENDIKRAYESVRSTVEGVVKGALSDIAGVDPSKILVDPKETDPKKQKFLLPREDEINENAKRLADIAVNGFKGQDWLGKFKEAVPDIFKALEESGDPRATAARMLKDFQDGLEPELIDKEKAKERVRKMLLGEAKMSELVKEITDELAQETGGDAGQISVLAKAALGVGGDGAKDAAATAGAGGTEAGAAFGKAAAVAAGQVSAQTFGTTGTQSGAAFRDAAVDAIAGTGDKLVGSLETQLKADDIVKRIQKSGEASGEVWGGGFLNTVGNNLPNALVDLLFSKLVPRLNAYNQTQAQLQGTTP